MSIKLTKQGIRDLGSSPKKKRASQCPPHHPEPIYHCDEFGNEWDSGYKRCSDCKKELGYDPSGQNAHLKWV